MYFSKISSHMKRETEGTALRGDSQFEGDRTGRAAVVMGQMRRGDMRPPGTEQGLMRG
jgi:hypothetical protein